MTTKNACPKCGGTQGFRYIIRAELIYMGSWSSSDDREMVDTQEQNPEPLATCMDCGKRMRWPTVEAMFSTIGGAE